ncbi:MAG: HAD-IA family hydrolase [Deinococcales bacterium]
MIQASHGCVSNVAAFVTRTPDGGPQLLVFRHPTAGVQVPAGTVEDGESIEAAAARGLYPHGFETSWKAYDDVLPCLDRLAGCRLGILTNGDPDQQRRKLEALSIHDRFELVITPRDAGVGKPHTTILQVACERAGVRPEACTHVGDDLALDARPAARIGMSAVWLDRSGGSTTEPDGVRSVRTLEDLAVPC